jgi:adenosylcobinamide-phosphate synthase
LPGSLPGLVLGYALDLCLGDPRRKHPVAVYGAAASVLERRIYADTHARGAFYWVACFGAPTALAVLAARATGVASTTSTGDTGRVAGRVAGRIAGTAVVTWMVLGQRSLLAESHRLADALEEPCIEAARERLPALCGRDASALDRTGLARAGVESLAENTSDAVVAPLLWGALLGVPGLVGYRAVNTLDAMVGNRSQRYRRFGWASARADDVANLLPARLTALLTCVAAPLVGGQPAEAWRTWRRDGRRHPSPNAGHCEAAAAGALGLRLGGRITYPSGVEQRPVLGRGRAPEPHDIRRAARLSAAVGALALGVCAGAAAVLPHHRSRR